MLETAYWYVLKLFVYKIPYRRVRARAKVSCIQLNCKLVTQQIKMTYTKVNEINQPVLLLECAEDI